MTPEEKVLTGSVRSRYAATQQLLHRNKMRYSDLIRHQEIWSTTNSTMRRGLKMDKKIAEQVADVTRKMVASVTGLQKVNERTMKDLAKQQVEAAEAFVTVGSKQLKGLSKMKSVQDVMDAQADVAAEVGKMMVSQAKQTMEVLARSQEELKALIEQDIEELVERTKAGTK